MVVPTVDFFGHKVSRLIVGGNPISGNSHFSHERDQEMVDYFTTENTKRLFFECERHGITAMQLRGDRHVLRLIHEYRNDGGRLMWIAQTISELANVRASVVYFDRRTQNADGTWSYDTTVRDNLEAYKKLAVRALGLGEYDDSAVEIQYMPSATAEPAVEGVSTRWPDILAWAAGAVATALALAALAGVAVALARMARRRAGPGREAPAQAREEEPGLPASEKLRRDVARAAASDVGRAAAILRRWMAREG